MTHRVSRPRIKGRGRQGPQSFAGPPSGPRGTEGSGWGPGNSRRCGPPCALARSPWLLQGEMGVTVSAPRAVQGVVNADVNYLHPANAACTLICRLLSEQPVLVFLFILGGPRVSWAQSRTDYETEAWGEGWGWTGRTASVVPAVIMRRGEGCRSEPRGRRWRG